MSAILKQIPITKQILCRTQPAKTLYGIRHGQAWHNVLFDTMGEKAYADYQDTSLTTKGMEQAATAESPDIDLVLVSPLIRTLQTAHIMFPNKPQIALECLKEYPQHTEICNKRSNATVLKRLFPRVDFSDLQTEQQSWPAPVDHEQNIGVIKNIIHASKQRRIAIVSHSSWLKYWINGSIESLPELKHCTAYPLEN